MSFSNRYLITLLSSIVRAGLNFIVSISVAKYLMPELYGNYQYILTILTAILLFINLRTEQAYFTFISKKKQHFKFHLFYFVWQFLQICLVFIFILSINQDIYQTVFKDIDTGLILIALGASFFVNNIQNSINHVVESIRKTYVSQITSIFIAILHLMIILGFIYTDNLNIIVLFQVLLFEYILYALIIFIILKKYKLEIFSNDDFELKKMANDFYSYSKPLFIASIGAFAYVFIDRWLIQTYIGAEGQAYFSISMQFSALTILVTSSILNIFWKEIAESIESNDIEKTKRYFDVVSKNLFLFTTVVATVLFWFSDSILHLFYSDMYMGASLVFKLIMLYPILQSLGQLYASFFYATSQTKLFSNITYFTMTINIVIAVVILSDFGFSIGIEGIAYKLLGGGVLSFVILEYYIAKYLKKNMDSLFYKIKMFIFIFGISYLVYVLQVYLDLSFIIQVLLVSVFYVLPIGIYLFGILKKELSS